MGFFVNNKHGKHSADADSYDSTVETTGFKMTPAGEKSKFNAPHALTAEEVINFGNNSPIKPTDEIKMQGAANSVSPIEALKQKMRNNRKAEETVQKAEATPTKVTPKKVIPKTAPLKAEETSNAPSLLDKCMPYIIEGGNIPKEEKPAYTLESIDSIINTSENKAAQLLEKLNRLGSVTYDDLSKAPPAVKNEKPTVEDALSVPLAGNTPEIATEQIEMHREENAKQPISTISDIDNSGDITRTISFEALNSNTEFEDISSGTKIIDLSSEIFEETTQPESAVFTPLFDEQETFKVADDYKTYDDAKRIGKQLIINRNSARIKEIFTIFLTLILAIARLPFIYDKLYVNPTFFAGISVAIFALICAINYDMFWCFKTIFKKQRTVEANIGILSATSLIYAIVCLSSSVNPYNMLLLTSVIISFKSIAIFMRESSHLGNFRVIATQTDKYGIKFIDDRHITFAMAKNSIEGDVLIGAPVKVKNIQDFLTNTHRDEAMNGKLGVYTVFSLVSAFIIALFTGIGSKSFNDFLLMLNSILAFAFAPTLLFTDILPLRRASKKLNKKGAMICGAECAKEIENANAAVINCCDLFPAGTISLYNMRVLNSNQIDSTILDAAAVASQAGSPIYPILENIAKTQNAEMPVADTVKYEERLGVSGWVGNRHIFIGNRTLLEAHGISTPSIEVDKKILRNGYFPIYIASGDKPCALLIVKYNVKTSIAYEMQRLTGSGVTLLVDSCDPNLTSEMIGDYFGIHPEMIRVMGSSGVQLCHDATEYLEYHSSGAAYRNFGDSFVAIFNCAAKIKRAITSLSIYHIIASVIMTAAYIYSSYLNEISPVNSGSAFAYLGVSLVISFVVYLFNRP